MYDNIADMVTQVGEILKQLEADGLADNTVVFYWSYHGDGLPRAKRSLYDSGLRVPLMIRWPKMSPAIAASANEQLVSMIDLAPTVHADELLVDAGSNRSEEHTSELQSLAYLVCRLLLEKKNYPPNTRLV